MQTLDPTARQRILDILHAGRDMSLATIRADGYPQATTVSYVNDGLVLHAVIGLGSQKAENIQHNSKVSGTIDLPYQRWGEIRAISFGGNASLVHGADAIDAIGRLMLRKFPEATALVAGGPLPPPGLLFLRIDPLVISLLDYRIAFGHTELYAVA